MRRISTIISASDIECTEATWNPLAGYKDIKFE
jgi:protein gp37